MAAFSTIALLGLSAFKASQQISAASAKSDAIIEQASLSATSKRKQVQRKAARIKSSFLTSGLTLEGTPQGVIQETFATGIEDVNQIMKNAKIQSKQVISSGRAAALGTLASTVNSFGDFGGGGIDAQQTGGIDFSGEAKGITVPFTGQAHSFSEGGSIIPPSKPTRINF